MTVLRVLRRPDVQATTPDRVAAVMRCLGLEWATDPDFLPESLPSVVHSFGNEWWVGEDLTVGYVGEPADFPARGGWTCQCQLRVPARCAHVAIAVLVHAWNDHDYGDSEATVRVYLFGALVHDTGPITLTEHDAWEVGVIDLESEDGFSPSLDADGEPSDAEAGAWCAQRPTLREPGWRGPRGGAVRSGRAHRVSVRPHAVWRSEPPVDPATVRADVAARWFHPATVVLLKRIVRRGSPGPRSEPLGAHRGRHLSTGGGGVPVERHRA